MKKQMTIRILVDMDSKEAKVWEKKKDYFESEIEAAIGRVMLKCKSGTLEDPLSGTLTNVEIKNIK
jgi:hypothetical protein